MNNCLPIVCTSAMMGLISPNKKGQGEAKKPYTAYLVC